MSERVIQRLMLVLFIVVLVDIAMQGVSFYQKYFPRRPQVVRAATPGTMIDLSSRLIEGAPSATNIIVEFSDYECPYCIVHANGVYKDLHKELVMTGKLRYAFVNNPLPIHSDARLLASAGICSGMQNRFTEMHDTMFEEKPKTRSAVVQSARSLDMDDKRFEECLDGADTKAQIDADMLQAKQMGLNVTPSFALGTVDSQGQVHVQQFIAGAQPLDVFEKSLKQIK
jgi:protein-disulfide isomerase